MHVSAWTSKAPVSSVEIETYLSTTFCYNSWTNVIARTSDLYQYRTGSPQRDFYLLASVLVNLFKEIITYSSNQYVSHSSNIFEYSIPDQCSVPYWLGTLNRWVWTYIETLYGTTHLRLKSWVQKCVYLVSLLAFIKFFINFYKF